MKKKEVERYLENNFKCVFLDKRPRKVGHKLLITIGDLYFDFFISCVDSDLSFPSTFAYGIGNSQYSDLLNYLIDTLGLNYQKNKYMIVWGRTQIRQFDEGKYPILEYDIYTEEDAQKMVDEVSTYILNEVLPEWEANPTLEYLEQKVNEKMIEVPNFSGLILSKLVNPNRYEVIKNHFLNISKDWADCDKEDLQKILLFLDTHSLDELLNIAKGKV